MRFGRKALFAVAITSAILLLGRAGGEPPIQRETKPHDFGNVVLYVVAKPPDSKSEKYYAVLEKPAVIRLRERWFIVGTIPDGDGEQAKAAAGTKVWIPESEVVQITEFKTLADVKRWFAASEKQAEKAGF